MAAGTTSLINPPRRKAGTPPPEPFKFDPNPLYACQVVYDEETGIGMILDWMAFDPKYGPESQAQIDWHIAHDHPNASEWEVGKPAKTPNVHP